MAGHFSYTPILSNKDFEIKDFNDKFTEVETYLNSSRDDIDSNKSRLDTLSTSISENTTNISGLDTRIGNAETRITDVENGKVNIDDTYYKGDINNFNNSSIRILSYDSYSLIDGRPAGAGAGNWRAKLIFNFKDYLFYRSEIQRDDFSTVPLYLLRPNFDFSQDFPSRTQYESGTGGYFIPGLFYDSYWGYIYDVKLLYFGDLIYSSTGTLSGSKQMTDKSAMLYYIDSSSITDSELANSSEFNNSDLSVFEEINPWMTWTRKQVIARPIKIDLDDSYTQKLGTFEGYYTYANVKSALNEKVDKVSGKGLSTNDFTNEYKTWIDGQMSFDDTIVIGSWQENSDWNLSDRYGDRILASNLGRVQVSFENYNCYQHWLSNPSDFLFNNYLNDAFKSNVSYPYMIGYTTTTTTSIFVGRVGGTRTFRMIYRK